MIRLSKCFRQLGGDDCGSVTLEYLVLMTFVGLGVVVGAHVLAASVNEEATELAQAITGMDQSWSADGYQGCDAVKSGGFAVDDPVGTITGGSGPVGNGTTISVVCCDGFSIPNPGDTTDPKPPGDGSTPPRSQGYWKNHPDQWPLDTITLGDESYTQSEALDILGTPTRGDASVILSKQLIAAKLNVANGATPSAAVSQAIADGDALLNGGGRVPQGISPSSTLGGQMTDTAEVLDNFNNGK